MAEAFARVYMDWLGAWSRASLSGTQERVLLCLCRWAKEGQGGELMAFCPRSDMAETLGIEEQAVKKALQALKAKGFVSVLEAGRRKKATLYAIRPYGEKGSPAGTPNDAGKGSRRGTPNAKKGVPMEAGKGTPGGTPTREAIENHNPTPTKGKHLLEEGEGDFISRFFGKTWRT